MARERLVDSPSPLACAPNRARLRAVRISTARRRAVLLRLPACAENRACLSSAGADPAGSSLCRPGDPNCARLAEHRGAAKNERGGSRIIVRARKPTRADRRLALQAGGPGLGLRVQLYADAVAGDYTAGVWRHRR